VRRAGFATDWEFERAQPSISLTVGDRFWRCLRWPLTTDPLFIISLSSPVVFLVFRPLWPIFLSSPRRFNLPLSLSLSLSLNGLSEWSARRLPKVETTPLNCPFRLSTQFSQILFFSLPSLLCVFVCWFFETLPVWFRKGSFLASLKMVAHQPQALCSIMRINLLHVEQSIEPILSYKESDPPHFYMYIS
jgi:hypothetical protein